MYFSERKSSSDLSAFYFTHIQWRHVFVHYFKKTTSDPSELVDEGTLGMASTNEFVFV